MAPRIVVGVDGSAHSRRALKRAIEEAALRGGTVDAIYVFPPPHRPLSNSLIGLPYGAGSAARPVSPDAPAHHPPSPMEEAVARSEREMEQFVASVVDGSTGPVPRVVAVADAHPAGVLIDESRNADLLVIGTRGLGGFVGMLLGSVAQHCIQHARCPMLILPPED